MLKQWIVLATMNENCDDFWQSYEHPTEGQLKMPGFPSKFSKTPASIRKHAPKLGEHSKEILAEAGIDEETINKMVDSKATLISD